MTEEEIKKLKHDLKRPFSNLEMLLTILKGSEMEKKKLIDNIEKILAEGKDVLARLDK